MAKGAKGEMTQGQRTMLAFTVLTIAIMVALMGKVLFVSFDSSVPKVDEGERKSWLEYLSYTTWDADKRTEDIRLWELGENKVASVVFTHYFPKSGVLKGYLLADDESKLAIDIFEDGDALTLDCYGMRLSFWLSESADKSFESVVIQGDGERLYFVRE